MNGDGVQDSIRPLQVPSDAFPHLCQCGHTVYVWGTYSDADNQAGGTLQCKGMYNGSPRDDDKRPLWLGLGVQECSRHDPRWELG